jgi:nitric oxide dioxygenase
MTMLSEAERALVRATWRRLLPMAHTAGVVFYEHLFADQPQVRRLFHGERREQARRLMAMIDAAVQALDSIESLEPFLVRLGREHAARGVLVQDYAGFGESLMWTLERGLGGQFTPQARQAWARFYQVLTLAMLRDAPRSAELTDTPAESHPFPPE